MPSCVRLRPSVRSLASKLVTTDEARHNPPAAGNLLFIDNHKNNPAPAGRASPETTPPPAADRVVEARPRGAAPREARRARHPTPVRPFTDDRRRAAGQRWCMNSVALDLEPR